MHSKAWRHALLAASLLLLGGLGAPSAFATFALECNTGCHGISGITGGGRVNAAGAPDVINVANTVNSMGTTAASWPAIAGEIDAAVTKTATTNVNYGSSNNVINIPGIYVAGSTILTTLERVSGPDRKSTRLNSSHIQKSRMPSSA